LWHGAVRDVRPLNMARRGGAWHGVARGVWWHGTVRGVWQGVVWHAVT